MKYINLNGGDFTGANILLSSGRDTIPDTSSDYVTNVRIADNGAATPIVEEYMTFYREYINYMNWTLGASDSLQIMALAQLCPEMYGAVVYQARSLYSFIYDDLTLFNDDSCMSVDSTYIAERHSPSKNIYSGSGITQKYELFPNPNDGNMLIRQKIKDIQPVIIEIWDAIGKNVYNKNILFNNNVYNLQLGNISPGIYIIQIRDCIGHEFRNKFVIE